MTYLLVILHVEDLDVVRFSAIVLCETGGTSNPLHPDFVVLDLKCNINAEPNKGKLMSKCELGSSFVLVSQIVL